MVMFEVIFKVIFKVILKEVISKKWVLIIQISYMFMGFPKRIPGNCFHS